MDLKRILNLCRTQMKDIYFVFILMWNVRQTMYLPSRPAYLSEFTMPFGYLSNAYKGFDLLVRPKCAHESNYTSNQVTDSFTRPIFTFF